MYMDKKGAIWTCTTYEHIVLYREEEEPYWFLAEGEWQGAY